MPLVWEADENTEENTEEEIVQQSDEETHALDEDDDDDWVPGRTPGHGQNSWPRLIRKVSSVCIYKLTLFRHEINPRHAK